MGELVERAADRDGEHGDSSVAFKLSTPINPDTFAEALRALLSLDEAPSIICEGAEPLLASAEDPITVWILNGFVLIEHIETVLGHHDPSIPAIVDDEAFIDSLLERPEHQPFTSTETTRLLRFLMRQHQNSRS